MEKFTVIVADDEKIVADGISKMISNEYEDIVVTHTCYDGESAIAALKENTVDLLITDICMPNTDGLQVAKYIRDNNLETKVVIITAFRNFEYAQAALEYRVHRIITKPIDTDYLLEVIEDLRDANFTKALVNTEIAQAKELIEAHSLLCKKIGLYISGELNLEQIINDFKAAGLNYADKPCAIIKFSAENNENLGNIKGNWRYMCETQNADSVAFCVEESLSKFTVVLFILGGETTEICESYSKDIKSILKKALDINIEYSYNIYSSIGVTATENVRDTVSMYVDYLMSNNYSAISDLLQTLSATYSYQWIKNFCFSVVSALADYISLDNEYYLKRIHFETTKDALIKFLLELNEKISFDSNKRIAQVKYYISEHFTEGITLNTIAEKFGLNSTYLSKMFSEETGEKFSNYFIRFKIEKAKEFLGRGKYSFEEIAEKLGYNSEHYFVRVFKRETGLTPKEYIKTVVRDAKK